MTVLNSGARRCRPAFVAMGLVGAAGLAGCASGGGGPGLPGADAAALLASISGRWSLDEASSTPQIPNHMEGVKDEAPVDDITRNESRAMRRYRRMMQSRRMSVADMRATIEVLRRRPSTLVLRVDEAELTYSPSGGASMSLPMDGSELETTEDESRVKSKVGWDGPLLVVEHQIVGGGSVRETLEVVGDRMIMTRTLSSQRGDQVLTLAYDRG